MGIAFSTTVENLSKGLEWWIKEHRNPTTPKDWEECMLDLCKEGYVTYYGKLEKGSANHFKKYAEMFMGAKELKLEE